LHRATTISKFLLASIRVCANINGVDAHDEFVFWFVRLRVSARLHDPN
jgi:hypothetical protein